MNAAYDEIADWYDRMVQSGALLHDLAVPALVQIVGNVSGQRVCDLACGQGVVARRLAGLGASVVGVDLSERLLDIARGVEDKAPQGISYVQDDAQSLSSLRDGSFDGVVCNMALMDIPNLTATANAVRRVLKARGWFAFSITHPMLELLSGRSRLIRNLAGESLAVQSYFVEGPWRSGSPDGVRGKVDAYHRTISTYVNVLQQVGLPVERMLEPQASGEVAARIPRFTEIPALLLARCRKI